MFPWPSQAPQVAQEAKPDPPKAGTLNLEEFGEAGKVLLEMGIRTPVDMSFVASSESSLRALILRKIVEKDISKNPEVFFSDDIDRVVTSWYLCKSAAKEILDKRALGLAKAPPATKAIPSGDGSKAKPSQPMGTAIPNTRQSF